MTDEMICYGIAAAVLGACAPAPLAGACLQPPAPLQPARRGRFFWGVLIGGPPDPPA